MSSRRTTDPYAHSCIIPDASLLVYRNPVVATVCGQNATNGRGPFPRYWHRSVSTASSSVLTAEGLLDKSEISPRTEHCCKAAYTTPERAVPWFCRMRPLF